MLADPATHPVILSYIKLPCINHCQPPSRPSCQWKPNFKQRLHQIHSVHIVLQLVRHYLITGLLVLCGQNYGIQYQAKNSWVLNIGPGLGDAPQPYSSAWICPVLRLWSFPPPPPPTATPDLDSCRKAMGIFLITSISYFCINIWKFYNI